jgi:hypothetical protein
MKIRFAPMSVLLLLSLVACSGDKDPSGVDQSSTLTRVEALGLATAYLELLYPSGQTVPGVSLAMVPDTSVNEFEGAATCPRGGTIQMVTQDTVIVDPAVSSMRIHIGGTHTPVNCGLTAAATNVTINGNPHFLFTSRHAIVAGMPSGPVVETLNGSFNWTGPNSRAGTCSASYTRTVNPLTGAGTEQGTICGYSFSF